MAFPHSNCIALCLCVLWLNSFTWFLKLNKFLLHLQFGQAQVFRNVLKKKRIKRVLGELVISLQDGFPGAIVFLCAFVT